MSSCKKLERTECNNRTNCSFADGKVRKFCRTKRNRKLGVNYSFKKYNEHKNQKTEKLPSLKTKFLSPFSSSTSTQHELMGTIPSHLSFPNSPQNKLMSSLSASPSSPPPKSLSPVKSSFFETRQLESSSIPDLIPINPSLPSFKKPSNTSTSSSSSKKYITPMSRKITYKFNRTPTKRTKRKNPSSDELFKAYYSASPDTLEIYAPSKKSSSSKRRRSSSSKNHQKKTKRDRNNYKFNVKSKREKQRVLNTAEIEFLREYADKHNYKSEDIEAFIEAYGPKTFSKTSSSPTSSSSS